MPRVCPTEFASRKKLWVRQAFERKGGGGNAPPHRSTRINRNKPYRKIGDLGVDRGGSENYVERDTNFGRNKTLQARREAFTEKTIATKRRIS